MSWNRWAKAHAYKCRNRHRYRYRNRQSDFFTAIAQPIAIPIPTPNSVANMPGFLDLFVCADGPSGSGRYWDVTIGVAEKGHRAPIRGVCLFQVPLAGGHCKNTKKLYLGSTTSTTIGGLNS
jgi:hypothetical protein